MPTNAELTKQVKELKAEAARHKADAKEWQELAEASAGTDLARTTVLFHDADGNPYVLNPDQPHTLSFSRFPEGAPGWPTEFADTPLDLAVTLDGAPVLTARLIHYTELMKAGTFDEWKKR